MSSYNSTENGMAVVSMVLGIASIPTICCGGFGLPLAATGIILALLSRRKTMSTPAKIGFGISLGSLIITLVVMAAVLIAAFTSKEFQITFDMLKELDLSQFDDPEELEEYLNDFMEEQFNYYDYPEEVPDYSDSYTDNWI